MTFFIRKITKMHVQRYTYTYTSAEQMANLTITFKPCRHLRCVTLSKSKYKGNALIATNTRKISAESKRK